MRVPLSCLLSLRRAGVVSGVAAACLALGCAGPTAEQRRWLKESREAYDRQQFVQSIEKTSLLLKQRDDGPEAAEALYLRGSSFIKSGRRMEGMADLRRCADLDTNPDATWRAYVVLGTVHFEDGQWEPARQAYSAAAARMPPEPPLPTVLWHLGVCCERTGRWRDARRPFSDLVQRFPRSNIANDARRRLELNTDHFSVQCGVFSQSVNAERLLQQLRAAGFDARARRESRHTGEVQVVLVGRYANYDEMLRQLGAVRRIHPEAVPWP
jgi:tetratricopeptide (TPR) repeat protein